MSDINKQKIFVDKVIDKTKALENEKKAIDLYKELVHYRFFEVISNANPIFYSQIKEKKLRKLIVKFIQSGAKTDLIWQLPNEFRIFVKKQRKLFIKMPYLNDLLWFEWIELKLFMKDYSRFKISKFRFKDSYTLSKSAKIKQLSYKVYEREFNTYGQYFVLAYYDLEEQEVKYREISDFMFEFLKQLKKDTLIHAIRYMSDKYELEFKDTKEILKEPLKELCSLGVIIKKD